MKKYSVLLLLIIFLCGCKGRSKDGSDTRPRKFPVFLGAPENAKRPHYRTQENSKIAKGITTLSYNVEDDFPPESPIKFVHDKLRSGGFFPLKYSLIYLDDPTPVQYYWFIKRGGDGEYLYLQRLENWCKPEGVENVTVAFIYRYSAEKQQLPSELMVHVSYRTDQADKSEWVKKYKQIYPAEEWESKIEMPYDKVAGAEVKQGRVIENKYDSQE